MQLPVTSRTVRRSFMAGAAVLLGAGACSRSDRAETGSDNTAAAAIEDTAVARATQDIPGAGQDRVAADRTTPAIDNTGIGSAAGDTARARIRAGTPAASAESGAAGYRAMEADTAPQAESDSARVTEDTAETSLNPADTAAEMARDTAGAADQIATAGAAVGADAVDTTVNAGRVRPIEDSTETMGQVTTDTSVTAAIADSTDAAVGARGDDTTGNAGRVRPPEDSTEIQGNVSSAESAAVNAADTADEAPVAPEPRVSTNDRETEVAPETRSEAAGAAAIGGTVTGADAVAMTSRQGEQCNVVDPESDEKVRWDMSSTPATLNPCGLGSMNLSKVWTAGQR